MSPIDKILDNLINKRTIYILIIAFVVSYVISMFLYPAFELRDWNRVQEVWYTWQPLNVGIVALVSSIIALKVASYSYEKQKEAKLVAAKAFLPMALSELHDYLKKCLPLLIETYDHLECHRQCKTDPLTVI